MSDRKEIADEVIELGVATIETRGNPIGVSGDDQQHLKPALGLSAE